MHFQNSLAAFGAVAKLLHWGMAALVIGLLTLGLYMHGLALSPEKFELYALHKSLGITALALALVRLGWRVADPPPAPLPSTPAGYANLAKAVHWALYSSLLAIPLTGWCMAAASGTPVDYFNTGFLLPSPVPASDDLRLAFRLLHEMFGKLAMALIALHIGAALKHHFLDKDATLRRMLPRGPGSRGRESESGLS